MDKENVVNYADDTTPFSIQESWDLVEDDLNKASNAILKWLALNHMQGNADKSVVIANIVSKHLYLSLQNEIIQNQETAKILGRIFVNSLTFEDL